MNSPRRSIADVCAERALLWCEFRSQYDLAGKRVTDNFGRAVGAPKTVQLGDGTTSSTFPTQLVDRHGVYFDGGDWIDTGIVDPFERTDKFTLFVASTGAATTIISNGDVAQSGRGIIMSVSSVLWMIAINNNNSNNFIDAYYYYNSKQLNTKCITYNGSSLTSGIKLYTNSARGETNDVSTLSATIKTGKSFLLGARHDGSSKAYLFGGNMYFAAIFPWDLTPQQVQYLDRMVKIRLNTPIVGRYNSRTPITVALQKAH